MLVRCCRQAFRPRCSGLRWYARARPHLRVTNRPIPISTGIDSAPSQRIDINPQLIPQSIGAEALRKAQQAYPTTLDHLPHGSPIRSQQDATKSKVTPMGDLLLTANQSELQQTAAGKKRVTHIPPEVLYDTWDTDPPTAAELKESRSFFLKYQPKPFFRAQKLLEVPFTSVPEVAFLGRSNVGKSSLINRLFNKDMAKTSVKPGKTKSMNGYTLGEENAKICLTDMPGYGRASREQWGREIMKYLQQRKELKRVFLLVDCIEDKGRARIKEDDKVMLNDLIELKIPHQIVITKADRALTPTSLKQPMTEEKFALSKQNLRSVLNEIKAELWGPRAAQQQPEQNIGFRPFGQLLAVSSSNPKYQYLSNEHQGALGIDAVRWAILVATGYAKALPTQLAKERQLMVRLRETRKKEVSGQVSSKQEAAAEDGVVELAPVPPPRQSPSDTQLGKHKDIHVTAGNDSSKGLNRLTSSQSRSTKHRKFF